MQLLLSIVRRGEASAMTRARERVREGESACEGERVRPPARACHVSLCVRDVCVCVCERECVSE